ncbi:hypothetical protein [Kangiella sp. HZ709]|uniref:hypothetical protein n=1 Tax=Kangiella sp. HZ709 TaxID=2666328 RepID=UPI0012B0CA04|nr:hypothetical protein [Kangiella sp. HZ709]MRX28602.1 hypothetical protein [Kangiella sp. HZ709]
MSKLKEFLKEIGCNAELLERYKEDPIKTMKHYGLSQEEIDAVCKLDMDKIKELVGDECDYLTIIHHIDEHKM